MPAIVYGPTSDSMPGSKSHSVRARERHRPGHAGLQAADDLATIAQQLGEERAVGDAQVAVLHQRGRQACQFGDAPGGLRRARHCSAFGAAVQDAQVVGFDELGGQRTRRRGRFGLRPLEATVVLGDSRERRQVQSVRQVVARLEHDGLQVHRARDQDQAGERHALLRQLVGDGRAARGAVALAGQVDRRGPALVARQPLADHFREAGHVAVHRQHLLARVVARGDRVAGVRRIDEHEVEMLEPAERVVLDLIRRRQHRAVVADAQAASAPARRVAARSRPSPGPR